MLIRSQDKTALVKFENIVVNLKLPDSLTIIQCVVKPIASAMGI